MTGLVNKLGQRLKGDQNARAFQFFSLFRYLGLLLCSIALARLFPDKTLVSNYERLLLLGGSVTFWWIGGLYDAFVVAYKKVTEGSRGEVVSAVHGLALTLAVLAGGSTFALGTLIYGHALGWETLLGYTIFIAGDSYAMVLVYFLLVKKRPKEMVAYTILSYAAYFLVVVGLAKADGLEKAMLGLGILGLAKAIYCFVRLGAGKGLPKWNAESRQVLRLGLPLGLAALLSYSATYLDSYLVEEFFPKDFANFRYGAKELPLVLLLANSLSIVQSGEVAEGIREGSIQKAIEELKAGGRRLMHFLFPISLLLLALSHVLFEFVFGKAFAGAAVIFDIYLLLALPRLVFPQSLLRGHHLTQLMGISAGIELGCNIALSLVGLYYFGIAGIAGATVIAYTVEKVVLVMYCKNRLDLNFSAYTAVGWWGLYSAALLGGLCLKYAFWA